MKLAPQSERGMALGMALTAIVIIGVLIAGAIYVSTQDYRIASNTAREAQATALADLGLNRILQDWNLTWNRKVVGDTVSKTYGTNGGTVKVVVTRVSTLFYWVQSEAVVGSYASQAAARRRYGAYMKLVGPDINFLGTLTAPGKINIFGSAAINGADSVPPGWSGCPAKQDQPGLAMSDTSSAKLTYCSGCVKGKPAYIDTVAASDTNTYFNYGNGANYQSLAASANITLPGGNTMTGINPIVSGGVCQTANTNNWGDELRATPSGACETYWPIIHVTGDLHISGGGQGQGILLVDGNLDITGGFGFAGIVIVRGSFTTRGTGAKVMGSVMAADYKDSTNSVGGNTAIRYSSCSIIQAEQATAFPQYAMKHAWVDMH